MHLLERAGRLDRSAAAAVERAMAVNGASAIEAIVAQGALSESEIAKTLADELRIPLLDLGALPFMEAAAALVDEATAQRLAVVPIHAQKDVLVLAMANPLDHEGLRSIEFSTGLGLRPAVAPRGQILESIQRLYRRGSALDSLLRGPEPTSSFEIVHESDRIPGPLDVQSAVLDAAQPPVIKLVNMLLLEAIAAGASDVHIEPGPNFVLVRYRIDGILEDGLQIPKWVQWSIIARVKVMSKLDITERRLPQDGHCGVRYGDTTLDVRVSSMPTAYGETIVLRLLDPSRGLRRLADIGLAPRDLATLARVIQRPEGMILVTGPTGSGKTTTLYAVIQEIVSPEINIVTIENPIEYELKGVSQIPINEKQGLTFAHVLRSVLRQDPDVILVGEIRDRETAEIAFQAAQTGHLVLSTVHTNDTAATVTRLLELGIEPHAMGPSLLAIVAQRLVRKVCTACAEPFVPSEEVRADLGLPADRKLAHGRGCPRCRNTGFSGRTGCYEVLEVTTGIEQLIADKAPETAIRVLAEEQGMTSILEDARHKILDGTTTPSEVLRVVELDTKRRLSCPSCHSAIEESFTTCPYCRTQLRLACAGCGVLLKERWTVCPYCGTEATAAPASVHPPAAATAEAAQGRGTLGKPRILIVQADPAALEAVRSALSQASNPVQVEVAASGEQALARAKTERPHLIILDSAIPDVDAHEVCRRLRADLKTALIPIIMLTGRAAAGGTRQAFSAGTDDSVAKPIEATELLARVERLLDRRYGWPARGAPGDRGTAGG
ncbi:MAG: Flp pilus assembly complex ATPase component TadA [Deltaproteobacteria bacterium]|nr:Flp pilus assembly complex ATPase component TadA [Deltaproteobacteria bacterium]